MQRTRTVFFDIGNTLARGCDLSPRRLLASRLALSEKETKKIGRFIMTFCCTEPVVLVEALEPMLPGKDRAVLRQVVESVWEEQRECVREITGAAATLARLKEMGYKVGAISNTWHPFYTGFREKCAGIVDLLDYTFLSYRLGCKKPSPDVFQKAVDAAGGSAASCWMVGDSYELDIEPARSIGMRTVWVLYSPQRERQLLAQVIRGDKPAPDWAVEDLREIVPLFRGGTS